MDLCDQIVSFRLLMSGEDHDAALKDSLAQWVGGKTQVYTEQMASSHQPMVSEVKIEIDVAEEPKPQWCSQYDSGTTTSDWSENSVSSVIASSEMVCWNPSAAATKSESDSQSGVGQVIKAEPIDLSMTGDMFARPEVNWQAETFGANSSADVTRPGTVSEFPINIELSTRDISSDILETVLPTTNINQRVQTEAATDNMSRVTWDEDEASCSTDDEIDTRAGADGKQKKGTPQPSARTSVPTSGNTSELRLNRSHACWRCSAAFVLFNSLKQHLTSVHGEKLQTVFPDFSYEDYDAGHCNSTDFDKQFCDRRTAGRKKEQADRIEKDAGQDSSQHACEMCSKVFSRAGDLTRHKLIHTALKQFVCDICNRAFTLACHLKEHKLIHASHKQFVCDVCSKAFSRPSVLKTHKLIHTGLKQFVCDVCSRAFTLVGHLNAHKLIHTGLKQFVCDICSKAFTQASTLKMHKLVHNDQKQFVCDVCSKAYSRPSILKTHKLIHSGEKQFVCDVCHKTFTASSSLKRHMLIHTGHKLFVCDVCGRPFSESGNLKTHKLTHTGHKPFVCDVCQRAFTLARDLRRHKLMHTGDKLFVCELCGKAFTRAANLKIHKLTHADRLVQ